MRVYSPLDDIYSLGELVERMVQNLALLILTVAFRVAASFQPLQSSSLSWASSSLSSSWANSRWHRHTPASRNIHHHRRINILFANFGIASEDEAEEVINGEASVQDTGSSASVDTSYTPSRLTGFSAEGRPRPYNNNNAEINAEETSSTVATDIEVPSLPSTSSVTTELRFTSPNTALPIDIQTPYNALNVEDFGLIPLVIIGISLSLALGIYFKQMNNDTDKGVEKQQQGSNFLDESKSLLTKIKDAGTAGAISYALWEAAFWGLSVPICLFSYRQVTGHWPSWQDGEDVRKVGLEAFAFVNIARLAVPIRIGLALSTIPWVEQNIVNLFNKGLDEVNPNEDLDVEIEEDKVQQFLQRYDSADNNIQTMQTQRVIRTSDGMSVVVPWQPIVTESSMIVRYDQSVGNRDDDEEINADDWNDSSFGEYCEPGKVNGDCAESIRGYLDSLASTSAIATPGEVKAIVGYLDSLSSNVSQNYNRRKGFVNYLDALSSGYISPPSSATIVANYLDALSGVATITSTTFAGQQESGPVSSRINEVEERLNRIESSITRLPDDIIRLLVEGRSPDI